MGALKLPLTEKFSTQHRLAFALAQQDMKTKEIGGSQHNPRILMYHACCILRATNDETAWCSSSANYWFLAAAYILNPLATIKALNKVSSSFVNNLEARNFFNTTRRTALDLGIVIADATVDTGAKVVMPTFNAMARSFLLIGLKSTGEEGDLVIFARGTDGVSGHVGFVFKFGTIYISTSGGNEDNQVTTKDYARSSVLGYRKVG